MDPFAQLRSNFLKGVPARLEAIEAFWRSGDREGLAHEVHKLRGAAGGYGFPELAEAAGNLEDALSSGAPSAGELDAMIERLRGLADSGRP